MTDAQLFAKAFRAAADVFAGAGPVDPTPIPPTPLPDVAPVGLEADKKLKLVWRDEFDGLWPDAADWRQGEKEKADGNHLPPGFPVSNPTEQKKHEKQFYSNPQVVETDGILSLIADKRTVKVIKVGESDARKGTLARAAGTAGDPDLFFWPYYEGILQYQSGWASTGPDKWGVVDQSWTAQPSRHEWLYGVFEVKVKVPKGKGFWPAAWMLRSDGKGRDEIDLFEIVDPAAKKAAFHYHCDAVPDWTRVEGPGQDLGVDLSLNFHTFSVDWSPDYIRWYFDGKLVQEYTDKPNICKNPMYFILNLAVGGSWPGDPDANTKFPQALVVDYLRVWQR